MVVGILHDRSGHRNTVVETLEICFELLALGTELLELCVCLFLKLLEECVLSVFDLLFDPLLHFLKRRDDLVLVDRRSHGDPALHLLDQSEGFFDLRASALDQVDQGRGETALCLRFG